MSLKGAFQNSIMQKGQPATADSLMLEGFIAPLTATVIARLESAGVQMTSRIKAGEFGVSGLFVTGDGALSHDVDFALCNDYTGAISRAAALQGLYYIHPTYGTVSRFGLIPSVTSMDQIGVLCRDPEIGFEVLQIISEYDSKDGMMSSGNFENNKAANEQPLRIKGDTNNPETCFDPCFPCLQIMQILCCAELSNNISRYDGIKFGHRSKEYNGLQELYTKSRTEVFGDDVKLAAIIGAMVLSQENYTRYYEKAMKIRRVIKDSFEFEKYDVIATCCPTLSRLCGYPALTTPECTYIADIRREDALRAVYARRQGVVCDGV